MQRIAWPRDSSMVPAQGIHLPIHNIHNVQAEIVFDNDENVGTAQQIHSYTTYDDISGHVSFRSLQTAGTEFDHVQIALTGFTKTFKHDHLTPQPSATQAYASHVFLRLTMPIPPSAYNGDFILKKNQPRSFPFHFVVPAQLLLTACKHPIGGEHVQEAHSNLPPSMGEYLLPLDDLAPEMAKISYAITAKLVAKTKDNGKPIVLSAAQRKMHIVPAISELPPTHVPKNSDKWVLSKTKSLRRGVFKGKLGTITASTSQPRALVLNPSSRHQPTQMATINFKFYPSEPGTKPPRIGAIGSKLRSTTYSSIRAVPEIPDDHTKAAPLERFSGSYNNTINLTHRCVENVKWEWHVPAPAYERRDSGYSTSTSSAGSTESFDPPQDNSMGWYEASVPIPVTLPKTKTWLPTFHSCLVSRFYTLILETSIHTPGTAVPQTNITLRCPIQIASVPREGRLQKFVDNAPRGEMVPAFSEVVQSERERGEREVGVRSEARRLREIEEEVDRQLARDLGRARRESLVELQGQQQQEPPGYEREIGNLRNPAIQHARARFDIDSPPPVPHHSEPDLPQHNPQHTPKRSRALLERFIGRSGGDNAEGPSGRVPPSPSPNREVGSHRRSKRARSPTPEDEDEDGDEDVDLSRAIKRLRMVDRRKDIIESNDRALAGNFSSIKHTTDTALKTVRSTNRDANSTTERTIKGTTEQSNISTENLQQNVAVHYKDRLQDHLAANLQLKEIDSATSATDSQILAKVHITSKLSAKLEARERESQRDRALFLLGTEGALTKRGVSSLRGCLRWAIMPRESMS